MLLLSRLQNGSLEYDTGNKQNTRLKVRAGVDKTRMNVFDLVTYMYNNIVVHVGYRTDEYFVYRTRGITMGKNWHI